MKIIYLIIFILTSSIIFAKDKTIVIDGFEYTFVRYKEVVRKEDGKEITKFLKLHPDGTIIIDGEKYIIEREKIIDYKNQEETTFYVDDKLITKGIYIRVSKDEKYFTYEGSYAISENEIDRIEHSLINIEKNGDDINFLIKMDTYYFTLNGVIRRITLEPEYTERPGPYGAIYSEWMNDDKELKEYIKKHNYKITDYETINKKKIKVFEIIFNKKFEVVQFFMRKIDYVDGTIGDTITVKFNKGKMISEVRGK
jgi:hypothetical protein